MNLSISETGHSKPPLIGVILAGGAGRRMGGVDKGLINLNGQPLIEHVLAHLVPQVDQILIVANRHKDSYATYGHPVIGDSEPDFAGPLMGMLSGLQKAAEICPDAQCLFVPVDAPLLPENLATQLCSAAGDTGLAVASNKDGLQPVCCLITTPHLGDLQADYKSGIRSPAQWLQDRKAAIAMFDNDSNVIWSLNCPDDLQAAQQTMQALPGAAA